jgi:putative phosphoesterase
MKLLIVSDIHANLEALQAVLAESHDELWVLGDLVNYGPNPSEVVDLVRRMPPWWSKGTTIMPSARLGPTVLRAFREMARAMQNYTEPLLDADQRAFLRGLPRTAARTIDGYRFFLCHATPTEPLFQYCPAEPARWASEIEGLQADIVLTGHTHLPFTMSLEKQRIVNPGSVGQPKHGAPMACYALWEDGRLSLQSRRYPVEDTVRRSSPCRSPWKFAANSRRSCGRDFLPAEVNALRYSELKFKR